MRYIRGGSLVIFLWIAFIHSPMVLGSQLNSNPEEKLDRVPRGKPQRRKNLKADKEDEKLSEQEIIQKVLSGYDWRVRPRGTNDSWIDTGGPVLVNVNIYLRSISKIDDVNMDGPLAYKRLSNNANKLKPFVVLATSEQGSDQSQQIWMPDTFFQNEKEARRHLIDKPNVLIRIYPDGSILYSVRLSLVLSCPMSLEYYPLDHQTCLIELASYAYTTDDIIYEWKKEKPIQLKTGLRKSLPSFELQDVQTDYCTSKTNTGEYSCLRTKLILRREFSYYLLQLYIPSFMLVIVSWVSFWLDKDSVPARVTLVNYAARKDMMMESRGRGMRGRSGRGRIAMPPPPPQGFEEAPILDHDDGLAACNAFAMTTLIQKHPASLPHTNYRPPILQSSPGVNHHQQAYGSPMVGMGPGARASFRGPRSRRGCWDTFFFFKKYKERSKRIDVVSRLVFPTGFFVFNLVYWAVYLL